MAQVQVPALLRPKLQLSYLYLVPNSLTDVPHSDPHIQLVTNYQTTYFLSASDMRTIEDSDAATRQVVNSSMVNHSSVLFHPVTSLYPTIPTISYHFSSFLT